MTPGNQRSVEKLCFHIDFFHREDLRVKQGVPGVIPLQTGHMGEKYFFRACLCCVSFSVGEIWFLLSLFTFPIC
jgi:hypothetical protein